MYIEDPYDSESGKRQERSEIIASIKAQIKAIESNESLGRMHPCQALMIIIELIKRRR